MSQGVTHISFTKGISDNLFLQLSRLARMVTALKNELDRITEGEILTETFTPSGGNTITTTGTINSIEYVFVDGALEFPSDYSFTGNVITFTADRFEASEGGRAGSKVVVKYTTI